MYSFPQDLFVSRLFNVCTGNVLCTVVNFAWSRRFVDSYFLKLFPSTFDLTQNYWTTEHDRAVNIFDREMFEWTGMILLI